jgi:outer membrane protein assembly factor BamB
MTRICNSVVALALIAAFSTVLESCHSSVRSVESGSSARPTATKKWEFSTGRPVTLCKGCYEQEQIPAIGPDGTIYAGGARGLYALRPDGAQKWYYEDVYQPTGVPIYFVVIDDSAITKNGTIYFGSLDNKLYAVSADGKLKWAFTTGGQVFSPAIADDGTIYVQNGEAKLYAIQDSEENGGLAGQWPKRGGGLRNTSRGGVR